MEFHIGDTVRIVTHDGATFWGILQEYTEGPCAWVKINGYGFPAEDIVVMEHA